MNWPAVKLGEVCEFKYGKSLAAGSRDGGEFPVYGSNGIVGWHSAALTSGPAIIVGRKGSFGEVAYACGPCWPIDTTYYIDSSSTEADLKWLSYRLSGLGLTSLNRAAAVPGLNREDAYRQELQLPPIDEQRRIAALLDHTNTLRGLRLETIAVLDDLVLSLFSEASGAGPSKVLPLSDAYWFQEGPGIRKWQFTDTGVKLLNVGNITPDGRLDLSRTERHISLEEANGRYKHFLVDHGDLVIASSGITFDSDGLLRTRGAFVDETELPLCMNTSTIRFKAQTGLSDLTYLRSWLNSSEFRSQISRLVTGSAQQNFGPSHLRQLQITLPPMSIQERFAQQVSTIERHRSRCLMALKQSDQMTDSIRFFSFTGRI